MWQIKLQLKSEFIFSKNTDMKKLKQVVVINVSCHLLMKLTVWAAEGLACNTCLHVCC